MKQKKTLSIITALGVSFILVACGESSSSGDTSTEDSLSLTKIDGSNQKQATAVLFDSIDITTPQLPSISTNTGGLAKISAPLFKAVPGQEPLKSISAGDSYSCSEGGSISSSYAEGVSTITYDNCQEANTTINGQIQMSYNESTGVITYAMSEYSISSEGLNYTTSATTYTISSDTISYTATGEATIGEENIAFNNYRYTLSRVDNKVNVSIDGSIKTACLGNWVTVKTNEVMQLSDNDCPTAGDFEVQGEGSRLRVKFSADKSVDVYLNDALLEEYGNCNELPDSSSVCGV
ncbi:hypothetical protein [Sulfurovum sp. TSL1]|uniref:hypothetical protein n=1 Tax=Sulfurovum sp. TSL1 TaxID=2826994 RepID=UPI001CC7050A|nr:hypothetical protein [Sulfurovum sp. TSL1]GIT97916.1 hypothetical protein TSL1_07370 [Sulfurovum sp. TSL1]